MPSALVASAQRAAVCGTCACLTHALVSQSAVDSAAGERTRRREGSMGASRRDQDERNHHAPCDQKLALVTTGSAQMPCLSALSRHPSFIAYDLPFPLILLSPCSPQKTKPFSILFHANSATFPLTHRAATPTTQGHGAARDDDTDAAGRVGANKLADSNCRARRPQIATVCGDVRQTWRHLGRSGHGRRGGGYRGACSRFVWPRWQIALQAARAEHAGDRRAVCHQRVPD